MKKLMTTMVICLCAALWVGFAAGKLGAAGRGAGGKVDPTAATVTLRDFKGDMNMPPDQIQSDGSGPYAGQVQQNTTERQILVNLLSGSKRRIWYDLRYPVSTQCASSAVPGPVLKDSVCFAILHASDIPAGSPPVARRAVFYPSGGFLNFGYRKNGNLPGVNCSFEVVVYRPDPQNWYVTTDTLPVQVPGQPLSFNYNGQTLPDLTLSEFGLPTDVTVGSQPQWLDSNGNFAGNYHVAFGMIVRCPGCTK